MDHLYCVCLFYSFQLLADCRDVFMHAANNRKCVYMVPLIEIVTHTWVYICIRQFTGWSKMVEYYAKICATMTSYM